MTVRNLDPRILSLLRRRAQAERRSLNSLVCEILAQAAEEDERRRRISHQRPRVEALRRSIRRRFGEGTPSEKLLREDRRR